MVEIDETPEAIVARVATYAPTFHGCLRQAIERAREYFEPDAGAAAAHHPFEPWLFAHLVRSNLKELLGEALPAGTPISVEEKTIMSSVIVHLDDIEIRFRKSEPGEVPPPGASERMIGWYAQTLDGGVAHNLLMLWHVDDARRYNGLDVAFPYGGTASAPLVRWLVPLPELVGAADDLDIALPSSADEAERPTGDVGS